MELALGIALAVVLGWAGLAKLRRRSRAADALAEHGVPQRLRMPLTLAVATVEIALAAVLATGIAPVPAGVAVAALGTAFAAFLLRARIKGRTRTSCGCFGGGRSANTIALTSRAAVLGALGAALAVGVPNAPQMSADRWQWLTIVVLGVLTALLVLSLLSLYRQVGTLSLRLGPRTALELEDEGPPLGHPAPLFTGLTRRGPELVAFISLNCRMCIEVVPGLRALERDGIPVHWVREDSDPSTFERWGVPGTPYVVHLIDGVVRSKGLVNTLEQIDWVIDVGTERGRLAA